MICDHPEGAQKLVRWKKGAGSVFVYQCQKCLSRMGRAFAPDDLPNGVHPKDVKWRTLKPSFRGPGNSKRRSYRDYLRSPAWKKLRARVLERDHFTCRSCGEPATEAGHITYDRFGEERLSDLVAQCSDCNQQEREERIAGSG